MRRTKADAAETKTKILESAERVFFYKGIANTTLEDIARDAGVTRGAIYWHFANKSEVLHALHDVVPLPQEELFVNEMRAGPADPLEVLERGCLAWLAIMAEDCRRQRIHAIFMRCEQSPEMLDIIERQRKVDDMHFALVVDAFDKARLAGLLAEQWSPLCAARVFVSILRGLYSDWLYFGMRFSLIEEGSNCMRELFLSFRTSAPS